MKRPDEQDIKDAITIAQEILQTLKNPKHTNLLEEIEDATKAIIEVLSPPNGTIKRMF